MSGGSYNYVYARLSEECEGRMYDVEMDDLIKDLCEVQKDVGIACIHYEEYIDPQEREEA